MKMQCLILVTLIGLCLHTAHSSRLNFGSQEIVESNPKTELKDLNEDCLRLIFSQLDVSDLYSLANTTKFYESVVGDVIKQRLAKKIVVFFMLLPSESPNLIFDEHKNSVETRYIETAIEFLRTFGRYIRNLKIQHLIHIMHTDRNIINQVYKLIQEHCSETLNEFQLEYMNDNFFDYITIPFKNVQSVSMAGNVFSSGNNLDFQQMFPAMRNLHLNLVEIQNTSEITLNYPNLEHLHIDICESERSGSVNKPVVMDLIRKNPQIRSIVLRNVKQDLLQFVSKTLVNLEKLTLSRYFEQSSNEIVHFEKLKVFRIVDRMKSPSRITFGKGLEEFEANLHSQDHKYIDFIENNKNVKKISLNGTFSLDNNDIQRLATANLNVIEMSIPFGIDVKAENIVQLINNCKQLNQLHLKIISTNRFTSFMPEIKELVSTLRKEFENNFSLNMFENEIVLTKNVIF